MATSKRKYIKEAYTTNDVRNLADDARAIAYRIRIFRDELLAMSESDNDADYAMFDKVVDAIENAAYREYDSVQAFYDSLFPTEALLTDIAHELYKLI